MTRRIQTLSARGAGTETHTRGRRTLKLICALTLCLCMGCTETSKQVDVSQAEDTAESLEVFAIWNTPQHVKSACDQALTGAESARAALKALSRPKLDPLLRAYQTLTLAFDTPMGLSSLMANTHPKREVREAAETCEQRLSKLQSALGLDTEIYAHFSAISPDEIKRTQPHTRRLYTIIMRDFKRSGVHLPRAQRDRLQVINDELTELSQRFMKNVNSDTKTVMMTSAELKGLPDDFIQSKTTKASEGVTRVAITTDYPDFFPFQRYAENRAARARLYRAFTKRGYPANKAVLKRVLTLRHEYAKLLGSPHWSAYNAGDKMVGDAETIDIFLQRLVKITRPISERELEALLTRVHVDYPEAKRVQAWDRFYYTNVLRAERHSFDVKSVRPYFSYSRVKDGIFTLYGELFGLSFKRDQSQATWSPEVESYRLYRGSKLIGRFFLDMHPRADKYKHAAMFPLQTGLKRGRHPAASLVCNFPRPSDDDPGLMEHSQVTTFFHEFGHLIHHLLAQETEWVDLNGINTEWDFVEAPSQLLEEWAWSHDVLKRFAIHHKTSAPISAELVTKMRAASEFGKGVNIMRQLFYAAYSFYIHQRDPSALDLRQFSDSIYERFSPYPPVEGGAIYANFGHLMGYSSMYYTYQWSLVIAKDLWSRFEREGLLSPTLMREYAHKVLAPGGSKPAAELARSFLGRAYNMEAYQRWLKR